LVGSRKKGILDNLFRRRSLKNFRKQSALLLDDFFFTALSILNVEYFLECGAHEAQASSRFCSIGKNAIAIEANPVTFNVKTVSAMSAGVEVLNFGLGASTGELEFYVLEEDLVAGNATFQPKANEIYKKQIVKVDTIDNIVQERAIEHNPIGLWVDVEGFSRAVLQGANQLLKTENCMILKIEVESFLFFEGQALSTEVADHLSAIGFEAIIVDAEYEQQFNVVFVKRGVIDSLAFELGKSLEKMNAINFGFFALFSSVLSSVVSSCKEFIFPAIKKIFILLYGEKNTHVIFAKFGSESSQAYLINISSR